MNRKIYLSLLAVAVLAFNACKKEYEEIGLPKSKLEGITSKWIVSKFSVTDKGGILEESMDMTDFYTSNANGNALPTINFLISGTDTTFICDTTGLALNIFGVTNGRWRFDNNDFPTKVILMADDKAVISEFNLLAPIRSSDLNLKISKSVLCTGGKTVFTYDLVMNRITN